MTVWREGATYDYYGQAIACVRRYFVGPLEHVDLAFVGQRAQPQVFTRTARALAPCVRPRVTATLGGVSSPASCEHDYVTIVADAGPHAGAVCCVACGCPSTRCAVGAER
jgi:hypothetical protein